MIQNQQLTNNRVDKLDKLVSTLLNQFTTTLPKLYVNISGALSVGNDKAPNIYIPNTFTPNGIAVYVKSPAVGSSISFNILFNNKVYKQVNLTSGLQNLKILTGLPVINGDQFLSINILSVGSTTSGSDLTVTIW